MNDPDPPKPKRRWYRFSLRTMLILVAVVSVVLGAFTWYLHRIFEFQETYARIEELGVERDSRKTGQGGQGVFLVGNARLGAAGVEFIGLGATTVTGSDLARLKEHLEGLP